GYTMAVIVPVSNQFRRDADNLYAELLRSLPKALAAKLDSTVLGGSAPGTGFDVLSSATDVGLKPAVAGNEDAEGVLQVIEAVEADGGVLDGWAVSPQGKALLRRAKDGDGRALLTEGYQVNIPQLLGAPVYTNRNIYKSGTPAQVGYAGQFKDNLYLGYVEGISISISDQASITDGTVEVAEGVEVPNVINLWQRNMFAVRAEMEVGVAVRDLGLIRKLTDAAAVAGS